MTIKIGGKINRSQKNNFEERVKNGNRQRVPGSQERNRQRVPGSQERNPLWVPGSQERNPLWVPGS